MAKKKVEDVLSDMHADFANVLSKWITKDYVDADGNSMPPPSHILREARQFLKDNGIEASITPGSPLDGLLTPFTDGTLPFTDTVN